MANECGLFFNFSYYIVMEHGGWYLVKAGPNGVDFSIMVGNAKLEVGEPYAVFYW